MANVEKKNIVKLKIFGTNYTLKTDADGEYVKKIADLINNQMTDLSAKNPDLPSYKIAVLCLIEVMDNLLKTQEKLKQIDNELSDKTSSLINKIEEQLMSINSIS